MLFSSQEIHIEVGTVNGDVTPHTFSTGLETQPAVRDCSLPAKSRMTLKTQLAAFPTDQHHAVDAAVRIVTGDTAFNFSCRVLVNERAVLVDVALCARFRNCPDQIEGVGSAVSIVTIRTLHRSFRNPVMHRQRKLSLYRTVARITKLRLWRFQQTVAQPARLIRSGNDLEELGLGCRKFSLA
jgi:hypothetical protein